MPTLTPQLALLGPLGWPELVVIGILGVLIFGKRLPEVGKSIGKGIVEFKKGLQGIDDEAEAQGSKKLEDPQARTGAQVDTESKPEATQSHPSA